MLFIPCLVLSKHEKTQKKKKTNEKTCIYEIIIKIQIEVIYIWFSLERQGMRRNVCSP